MNLKNAFKLLIIFLSVTSQLLFAAIYTPPQNGQAGRLEFEGIDIGNNKKFSVVFIAGNRSYLHIGQVFQIKTRKPTKVSGNPDGRYSTVSKMLTAQKISEEGGIVHNLTIRRKTDEDNSQKEFFVVEKIVSQLAKRLETPMKGENPEQSNVYQEKRMEADKMRPRQNQKTVAPISVGERGHLKQ